jgi:uncharacterized iron-regulated membrane protein
MNSTNSLVKSLRLLRTLHKYVGITAAVFLFVTSATGLLLGWKKNSATLQPPTKAGVSQDVDKWKSFQAITDAAIRAMDSTGHTGNGVDRMDVRPDKGMIKVLFKKDTGKFRWMPARQKFCL